jgi:tricorn protease
MRIYLILVYIFSFAVCSLFAFEPHFASDPAISPDGTQVCFVYGSDLWTVPFDGGTAKRLTSTPGAEYGPTWSPDGKFIAFTSNREGQGWVYTMPATGGHAEPVFKDGMTVCDWFSDSRSLLCAKSNLTWGTSLYKTPLDGQKPMLIAEIGDYFSTLSPDNESIIFNRYGDAYREAYRGSANGELWSYDIARRSYTRLTDTDSTERYPQVSHVSDAIYFCASDGARYQIYKAFKADFNKREKLTDFPIWSARDLSVARQNDRITFELFDAIWCYDPAKIETERTYKLNFEIAEDDWHALDRDETLVDTFEEFAVSGDELLLAFSYKYDLFVLPRKGGQVRQLTFDQAGIENVAFLSDNRTLVFSRYKDGLVSLYKTKIDSISSIVEIPWYGRDKFNVDRFYASSDSIWAIEYTDSTGGGRIALADSTFTNLRPVITDRVLSTGFVTSPDGSMAVYATMRNDINARELYLYNFTTQTSCQILTTDNWIYALTWLPDQKSILLSQSNDENSICRLDLVPRDALELDHDNWKEILSPEAHSSVKDESIKHKTEIANKDGKITGKPLPLKYSQIDWLQIDSRLTPIITDPDYIYPVKAIDDTSFYYIREDRGKDKKSTLLKANLYGKFSTEIASLPQDIDHQFTGERSFYYKDGSTLRVINLMTKTKNEISNNFTYAYNLKNLNEQVFAQVWGIFGRNFYDPGMHNTDWNALYKRFQPYLKYAESTSVLETLIEEMIGEVNASHTGYYPRNDSPTPAKTPSFLGLEFDQRNGLPLGQEVSRIYPGSVLYGFYGIRPGDRLVSINGCLLTSRVSVDSLLLGQVDKKLQLVFRHGEQDIRATVKGLGWSQNRELWYQDKLERRREKTDELSGGRVGYVLIPRMSGSEYSNFISDIFSRNADKDALIIDIRGNVGGHIHNELLNFLAQQPNALTTSRKYGAIKRETPGRTWTKPLALLIDENSFSDAEIFPQLFKEANLGTVIGMPTSGSVIGTWEVKLLDGSSMRMPGSGWYRLDGTNMEGNGVQPDVRVEMSLDDVVADNDIQLQQAVDLLLEKLQ